MHAKTVIIEGLIGVGKSSLSAALAKYFDSKEQGETLLLVEPDETNNPYLADYYEDPERWSFAIQIHLLQARLRMHLNAQWHVMANRGHAVLDRSYFGDVAFAYLQLELGHMTKREFDTYRALYTTMTAGVLYPNICLHLMADPKTAQNRIQRRIEEKEGRVCEEAVSLEYLQGLDREVTRVVGLLERQGTEVYRVMWDEDLDYEDEAAVEERVGGLARLIDATPVPSTFPDFNRRIMF